MVDFFHGRVIVRLNHIGQNGATLRRHPNVLVLKLGNNLFEFFSDISYIFHFGSPPFIY